MSCLLRATEEAEKRYVVYTSQFWKIILEFPLEHTVF